MDMFKKDMVVAVKVNGQIMRETGEDHNEILLPFGCEYSLLFKNKRAQRGIVSVEIDGQDVLSGGALLIGANQEVELERFIESLSRGNRFRFIQKTEKIQQHRGDKIDDGIIRIEFQYEKQRCIEPTQFRSKGLRANSLGPSGGFAKSMSLGDTRGAIPSMDWEPCNTAPATDEGITVKGSESNQQFRVGSIGELEDEKYTIVFKLKGATDNNEVVTKPVTVKTKIECPTCGTKSKAGTSFCPDCGTHL